MKREIVIDNVKGVWTPIEEVTVPPGIVSFKQKNTEIVNKVDTGRYEQWASAYIDHPNWLIHSIEVDGITWEVGEKVYSPHFPTYEFPIKKFMFHFNEWFVELADGTCSDAVKNLKKLPAKTSRKPVVTIDGIDLFVEDKYWVVEKGSYHVSEMKITECFPGIHLIKYWKHPSYDCFPTLELAKAYVLEHRPCVPWTVVNAFFEKHGWNQWMNQDFADAIKKYKPTETI